MAEPRDRLGVMANPPPMPWPAARAAAYAAGRAARPAPVTVPLAAASGLTLAEPLRTLTPLPAFCGYDYLPVVAAPRVALVVFGDELRTAGPPGDGQVRDSLGPQLPGWLRRLGAQLVPLGTGVPVADTLAEHLAAIRRALAEADVVCTTGGTMR